MLTLFLLCRKAWINSKYIQSLPQTPTLSPTSTIRPSLSTCPHSHPLSMFWSTELSALCNQRYLALLFYGGVNISGLPSQFVHPQAPRSVCKSILYAWVSIPTLHMGSSVPFFQIPCACVNKQHLLFFPDLTVLTNPQGSCFRFQLCCVRNKCFPLFFDGKVAKA